MGTTANKRKAIEQIGERVPIPNVRLEMAKTAAAAQQFRFKSKVLNQSSQMYEILMWSHNTPKMAAHSVSMQNGDLTQKSEKWIG